MSGIGQRLTVKFEGSDEPVVLQLRPVGMMAAERKWGGEAFKEHPIEATLLGAWVSAAQPTGDFDTWAATITDLVTEDVAADPTLAAPPEPSPTSQSEPA